MRMRGLVMPVWDEVQLVPRRLMRVVGYLTNARYWRLEQDA